ncbi:hypothetical protein [Arcobacter caeni]|uniref:Uncharacterized protein n=1 Tax=Arcobacter caeni TaxID=1912877 RepID=A0A363D289_9BACT|nr:hypothetical protein [Arcobacter caeni]PUE65434.1 hypothetical protein B0174_03670 [Arcobacter caeni]
MKELLNSYTNYIKNKNKVKLDNRKNFKRKTLLRSSNPNTPLITLFDVENYTKKVKKSIIQNEISSISQKIDEENKNLMFITTTLNPKMNLTREKIEEYKNKFLLNDFEIIEKIQTDQYETFKSFNNKIVKYYYKNNENENITLKTDFLRVLELTKNLNIHQHQITLTNDINETIEVIRRIILKRTNEQVGRIEIRLKENLLNEIMKKGIIYRLNNKVINVTFKQIIQKKDKFNRTFYKLTETEEEKGNFIYLKPILNNENNEENEQKNTNLEITKYLFKYLLKSNSEESFENQLFHNLEMRQNQYSHNFFTDKINKSDLFKISSILYKNLYDIQIKTKIRVKNTKGMIYETRKLLNNNIIEYNKKDKIIIYNNKEKDEKEELLHLNKYEKETIKGKFREFEVIGKKSFHNEKITMEEEYKWKKLLLKQTYEKQFLQKKLLEKKKELKLFNTTIKQFNDIKKQFPNFENEEMTKIHKNFGRMVKYLNFEKELKKDWEMNYIFYIHQNYNLKDTLFLLSFQNYKTKKLNEKEKEKRENEEENLKMREEKEKYFSNLIENRNYKIETIDNF